MQPTSEPISLSFTATATFESKAEADSPIIMGPYFIKWHTNEEEKKVSHETFLSYCMFFLRGKKGQDTYVAHFWIIFIS